MEYSAREAYSSSRARLASSTSPLTPAWWHNVTVDMEDDDTDTFEKYRRFTTKSSPIARECDDECKRKAICNIRAGNSEHRCDYESDVFEPEQKRQKTEIHLCGLNIFSQ